MLALHRNPAGFIVIDKPCGPLDEFVDAFPAIPRPDLGGPPFLPSAVCRPTTAPAAFVNLLYGKV